MAESDKHLHFKGLVATILLELKAEGMRIRGIQQENERRVDKHIEEFKNFKNLNLIQYDDKDSMPYTFCLMWAEDENIRVEDIFINLLGYTRPNPGKYIFQYNSEMKDFIIIKIKSEYGYYNKHSRAEDPVNFNFNGTLFLVGIRDGYEENHQKYLLQYRITETKTLYKTIWHDVGCRYKRKPFGIEIGNTKHHNRSRCLVLDYDFLNHSSYLTIKRRIRRFLIKHTKET
jgi:hypothetical protein